MSTSSTSSTSGEADEQWAQPVPYGITAARQSMSGGAAALLAGFSIALVGVIAQAPTSMRWPGWALLLLTVAASLLVACVQCGFWARAYLYSYQEIQEWRPPPWAEWETGALRDQQKVDEGRGSRWEGAAEWTYHLGLVALAVGVGLVLAPLDNAHEAGVRWAAACVAFIGGIAQGVWGICGWWVSRDKESLSDG